ncbi:hypothetical protein O6H91_11G083200 [Diphasiastrum complanatum]|uniref:Uncharacterized protein n=1 Tax=Diphasiastrum complanatum TaxID=34168 RepID=A0ACC2CB77_DIPCM|nr:hypothetical protein O6H91_11G083200 [Diphasiastrum complanatum]
MSGRGAGEKGGKEAKPVRRVRLQEPVKDDGDNPDEGHMRPHSSIATEEQEPFMGMKVRRRSSMNRAFTGDYLEVASNQQILKLLSKQGDRLVLFADTVVKVNRKAKIRRRILLITDVAIYTLDADWCNLKRRIALNAVGKVCLSELNDNFFAIIVPSEYDCLFASTRKTEIVTILVEATKNILETPLEVNFSNRFEYYMDSEHVREVIFEEAEGGVKTKFISK